jgi:hypothetical protein
MTGEDEAVIVAAEIGAGHDGTAELILSVRYQNGVVGPVILDTGTAMRLMSNCGVSTIGELAGHPFQNVLEKK